MIRHAKPGDRVRLHYAARKHPIAPHHGRHGTVLVAGRGPGPHNVLVRLDGGPDLIVPAGNLLRERTSRR